MQNYPVHKIDHLPLTRIHFLYTDYPVLLFLFTPIACFADVMHGSMHFNLSSVNLHSYVQIVSKFGLSRCSFSDRMTLVDQCSPLISLIGWPIAAPLFLGPGHSVDSVLAMCAHPLMFICILCQNLYHLFITASLKIMLLCGLHWHSRYSIWISTFVLSHTV